MENFSRPLVDWYKKEARPLPWREEPTPYRVWVSEIMLQQTRIEAAREYFNRFTRAALRCPPTTAPDSFAALMCRWL